MDDDLEMLGHTKVTNLSIVGTLAPLNHQQITYQVEVLNNIVLAYNNNFTFFHSLNKKHET
jgi:hypothetical protein